MRVLCYRVGMKIHFFAAVLMLTSAAAFAGTAKCRITEASADSAYAAYQGGKILIDLESGNTTLIQGEARLQPITGDFVTSFRVPRQACNFGTETILRDGSIRAILFKFNDCMHTDAEGISGYVRSEVGFDLKSNSGKYQEIFFKPWGENPYAFIDFQDCQLL